jgi:transcriptional regulator with XRE-family HTH domain
MAVQKKDNLTNGILSRLKEFLQSNGDNLATVAEKIGVSASYFSTAKIAQSEIGSDKIAKILLLYPQLSADWLLTGIGLMLKEAKSLKNQSEIITSQQALQTAVRGIEDIQNQLRQLQKQIHKPHAPRKSKK